MHTAAGLTWLIMFFIRLATRDPSALIGGFASCGAIACMVLLASFVSMHIIRVVEFFVHGHQGALI